ncbi:HAD-IA family hydrolase [Actinomarinicola tropica]|uniref:HAD-IA family hydrolase n=1 Tax=Actinomarinicola tropica TaxID=2789776 RepID=A0A5Q2RJR3_9ACTN|nr:HAD-IA family hydrolase [Actinomarinicola tropica]QGG94801.1 HAD-IA family hydrolase [Actinomarinicola tropica]
MIRAALFDFGGVILSSPFEAFDRYERENGLPEGLIRTLNATNPDDNAWAKLERSQVDLGQFAELFEAEARAVGYEVDGRAVLGLLGGTVRPEMVEALRRCKERLLTGLLTNNFVSGAARDAAEDPTGRTAQIAEIMGMFDAIVESSKVGVRKPDPRFYEMACEMLGIEPSEAVFLDDLGINLKPARALGMTTIKVVDPDAAIRELEAAVGFPLR